MREPSENSSESSSFAACATIAPMSDGRVKVDLGRGSAVALVTLLPVWILLCAAAVYAVVDAEETMVAIIGGFFALFFSIPLVLVLFHLKKLLAPRGLLFDARGVHYWQGETWALLQWDAVAAVGIGYDQPPDLPALTPQDYLKDKIIDALIDRRRRIAIEIFPADLRAVELQPLLARYRRDGPAPTQGLPRTRWRVPLPPMGSLAASVANGVQGFRPERWLGWFERPKLPVS